MKLKKRENGREAKEDRPIDSSPRMWTGIAHGYHELYRVKIYQKPISVRHLAGRVYRMPVGNFGSFFYTSFWLF